MKPFNRTGQTGYALILMVLLLMGIGGVVLAGFTQNAKQETEHERYLHNQRVLKEAKRALLQYAYNYPQTGPDQDDGPGRLPCPDTNNNGEENYLPNCSGNLVGRFPWKEDGLEFYDARDASGEHLWYAVSSNFGRGGISTINSASTGGITVEDRSGALIHDASNGSGVAAVIIAPGARIARNGVMQVRGTAAEKKDVLNYLDRFGAVDNADFVDGDADNGFVTGPIDDMVTGDLFINDQMIVVTAAEVIAMAEKATLQAYRQAIKDYLDKAGSCTGSGTDRNSCEAGGDTWNPVYPWLYNYRDVFSIAELSSFYPAFTNFDDERDPDPDPDPDTGYLDNYGRIPSIFADYFTETDSLKIESKLVGQLEIDFSSLFVNSAADGLMEFADGVVTIPFTTADVLTDIGFDDLADVVGSDGRFTATSPAPQTFSTGWVYFWDDDDNPTDVWRICANDADDISDCWRENVPGAVPPHASNDNKEYILRVRFDFTLEDTLNIDVDYDINAPTVDPPTAATADSHAIIQGTYDLGNLLASSTDIAAKITVTYEFDHHYHAGVVEVFEIDPVTSFGELTSADLMAGSTLTLGMRYYPELPIWALDNGWHNSIRMAYADISLPSLAGVCVPPPDGDNTNDCLTLPEELGAPRNIASLLVIAGEHGWVDDECATVCDGMADELRDVFDNGNHNNNRSFYTRRSISPLNSEPGNDKLLVIEEL